VTGFSRRAMLAGSACVGALRDKSRGVSDVVEKVASWSKQKIPIAAGARRCSTSDHCRGPCEADFGELAQVLGGCGEKEFVSGPLGPRNRSRSSRMTRLRWAAE
jgi:hypothetical protein